MTISVPAHTHLLVYIDQLTREAAQQCTSPLESARPIKAALLELAEHMQVAQRAAVRRALAEGDGEVPCARCGDASEFRCETCERRLCAEHMDRDAMMCMECAQ